MADEIKVYTPTVIDDAPFPQEDLIMGTSQTSPSGALSPSTIKDQTIPTKRIAVELLSSVLNTRSKKILQEFQFTQSGALQIGKYENGVSGDLRISPAGITARNTSGLITLSIDGETGDAVFAGELRSGSVITETVILGNSDIVLDGENRRIVFFNGNIPEIVIGSI